jgi:hypothetical protein
MSGFASSRPHHNGSFLQSQNDSSYPNDYGLFTHDPCSSQSQSLFIHLPRSKLNSRTMTASPNEAQLPFTPPLDNDYDMLAFSSPGPSAQFSSSSCSSPWSEINIGDIDSIPDNFLISPPQTRPVTPTISESRPQTRRQRPRRLNCLHPTCNRRFMSEVCLLSPIHDPSTD